MRTQPNKLHPNDTQNLAKHRKMIRRGAEHPRNELAFDSYSFYRTTKMVNVGDLKVPNFVPHIEERIISRKRNDDWVVGG